MPGNIVLHLKCPYFHAADIFKDCFTADTRGSSTIQLALTRRQQSARQTDSFIKGEVGSKRKLLETLGCPKIDSVPEELYKTNRISTSQKTRFNQLSCIFAISTF